jgi:CubicO group peptidase (beta-lactamase class C family)
MMRSSRRSFLAAAAAAAIFGAARRARGSAGTPGAVSPGALPQDLAALIESERRAILDSMSSEDIPGVAVSLMHEGKRAWIEGIGVTDRFSRHPVSVDTLFSIQSTSKNITAVAMLIAVQRGLLELDRPIAAYWPGFAVRSRFEELPQQKMTLRLLLTHRAGFTHEAPVGNNYDASFPSFAAHVRSIGSTWLRCPVGERYRYSNLGFDLAGYILEMRAGVPFAEWLRTQVFEPIGMLDSTAATSVYAHRRNRALGHEKGFLHVPLETPLIPSGGVYTSARDMAAYGSFHLSRGKVGGRTVLDEGLWNEMHGFSLGGDYGLGVIRTELRYGDTSIRSLGHRGGGFGFGSTFDYCPDTGLAWCAMFNRPVSAAYRFGNVLTDQALERRYGKRRARLPTEDLAPIRMSEATLGEWAGNYVGRNLSVQLSLERGVLGMRDGASFTPIRFLAPDRCFTADGEGDALTYDCFHAAQGEPAHLECAVGERSLDRNDAATRGPDEAAWEPFLGRYRIEQWGQAAETVTVRRENGYLYLDGIRLIVEHEPGLFFTSDGEAVDFRSTVPTWKNIRLTRTV